MKTSEDVALIFDIQGFSVHDGPGGRTLIFFKGCPLRCTWCSNPEGECRNREVMFREDSCKRCYNCVAQCPEQAIMQKPDGAIVFDRARCQSCDALTCVEYCYDSALGIAGKYYTQTALMHKIERDRRFWGSGGGITLGGGEVMAQYKFAARFLEQCHRNYIHTAIETSGYASWPHYEEVLQHTDWVFVDIKHMDAAQHRVGTGVSNTVILENIRKMAQFQDKFRLIPRIPVIPGFNDDERNMQETARFLTQCGLQEVNVLPFHRLGSSKYEQLSRQYDFAQTPSLTQGMLSTIKALFEAQGIRCYVGSDTPF
ncbi:glycyl-radical enzyme activating protein [Pluralibacter sp.]|uniref:glycyl-radical enzyme activating protein n=1 Tax=Pluralibacter sp. TaxID=1920032 RepID=UPI0025DECB10|nr:glycyl-radical enzyme activating protein [Pluralibacter sp.]MBV8043549.1 glycyl-radical enzyme activating protein [Pluralibacter sp.]